jgi:hypothetical protein
MRAAPAHPFPAAASAAELRRMAMQYAEQADRPDADEADRDTFRKMHLALLSLAATEDWLNGQSFG